LDQYGEMPLPPYIERRGVDAAVTDQDRVRYQTVYAAGEGSVAAPTAGLHFTDKVIASLKEKGCRFAPVTLHVGAGTFLPVKSVDISQHEMHSERFMIPKTTLAEIQLAKSEGRPVIVVGTTALRSLEGLAALAQEKGRTLADLTDAWNRTRIFIRPIYKDSGHKSWAADALMTNFHQPESTLLMLVSALVGYDPIKMIYGEAIRQAYRFFSYGDSSLLWLRPKP
jgi:S-adenosylmethionine:tRNA ribosyltransferase-isomerase